MNEKDDDQKEKEILDRLAQSPLKLFQEQKNKVLENNVVKEVYRGTVIE